MVRFFCGSQLLFCPLYREVKKKAQKIISSRFQRFRCHTVFFTGRQTYGGRNYTISWGRWQIFSLNNLLVTMLHRVSNNARMLNNLYRKPYSFAIRFEFSKLSYFVGNHEIFVVLISLGRFLNLTVKTIENKRPEKGLAMNHDNF